MPDMRFPRQPIPDELPYMPEYTPRFEFTGKPLDAMKRQYVVWNAGEILRLGYGNRIELDVLQFIRFVN